MSFNLFSVKGSWSTKVEQIIRCVIKIISDDPVAKILIFSTWQDVLQLISNALLENEIKHCCKKDAKSFTRTIDSFKQTADIKVLLLPINSGSKGLNLIEATHVILVEPTLNKANELQAVGRVHRIGQTKYELIMAKMSITYLIVLACNYTLSVFSKYKFKIVIVYN